MFNCTIESILPWKVRRDIWGLVSYPQTVIMAVQHRLGLTVIWWRPAIITWEHPGGQVFTDSKTVFPAVRASTQPDRIHILVQALHSLSLSTYFWQSKDQGGQTYQHICHSLCRWNPQLLKTRSLAILNNPAYCTRSLGALSLYNWSCLHCGSMDPIWKQLTHLELFTYHGNTGIGCHHHQLQPNHSTVFRYHTHQLYYHHI